MSVYDKENPLYFRQALDSLCVQTVLPDEVVLVKDGLLNSELDSVISSFKDKLPLTVVQLHKNIGLAAALNHGMGFVTNPWIIRFDSDDVCCKTRIELQKEIISNHGYDFFGGQIEEFDSDMSRSLGFRSVPLDSDGIDSMFNYRNPFNHVTMCYKKDIVVSVGGYPNIPGFEDYALWGRLMANNLRYANVNDVLVKVRAGRNMLARRSGIGYLVREYRLQKFLYQIGKKDLYSSVITYLLRSAAFLMPVSVKKMIYSNFLRDPS